MVKVKRVEPLVIAVKSLKEAIPFFENVLGAKFATPYPEEDHMLAQFMLGDSMVELLEPVDPDGPVAKFIERKGGGVYAVNLQVEDLEAAITELESKGLRLLGKQVFTPPQSSLKGTTWSKMAFLHPRDAFGVLLVLGETKD